MVPRGEMTVLKMMVSREWGLVAGGRYALLFLIRCERVAMADAACPFVQTGFGRKGRADVLQCRGTADGDGGMQE